MRKVFIFGIVVAALAVAGSAGPLSAQTSPQTATRATGGGALVLPPWLKYHGKSLAGWQRRYFEWASLIPTDGPQPHPGLTEGDVDCSYAQRGQVWFLELGGVERRCSIPFGKTLYVPVNFWFCMPKGIRSPSSSAKPKGMASWRRRHSR